MKNLRNKNAPPPEQAIQSHLSTAWDKVLAVYNKLAEIEAVADQINGPGLDYLSETDIDTLAELNAILTDAILGDAADFATAAQGAKVDFLTITQPVDLDQMEARLNELDSATILKGNWDASVGTFPGGGLAQPGWSYIVSVAGVVDGVDFNVNDRVIAIIENASDTVYTGNWIKMDYTDNVLDVVGLTGSIGQAALLAALGVEAGATADQTGAEIKAALFAETDTNNLTDALLSKLNGIQAGAQVNRALASQAEAEAGTDNVKGMTPLRVAQAIAALGGGGGMTWNVQGDANFNPVKDNGYVVDGLSASRTATLPASPAVGDTLIIWNNDDTPAFPYYISVDPGGSNELVSRNVTVIGPVQVQPGEALQVVCFDAGATKRWYYFKTLDQVLIGSGGGLTPVFKTANYTASAGEIVFCDTTGGAFTVTLPLSPGGADNVVVVDAGGAAGAYNITVARNSETIDGDTADFVIDQNYGECNFAYDSLTADWKIAPIGFPTIIDANTVFVVYKTAAYTANSGERVMVGSDSGAITITLPASPAAGYSVGVWDADNNAGTNNITIDRNGETIDGAAANDILDVNAGHFEYIYDGSTWKRSFWAPNGVSETQVQVAVTAMAADQTAKLISISNLADDTVAVFDFGKDVFAGQLMISHNQEASAAGPSWGIVIFRAAASSAFTVKALGGAKLDVTTGVLTGTTGTDGNITISAHTDRSIYIENRAGAALTFCLQIAGASLDTPQL